MTERQIQDAMLQWLIPKSQIVMMNYHFKINESDVFAIYKSGYAYNYEIKISVSDFKADFKKAIHSVYLKDDDRFRENQPFNRWCFVVDESIESKVARLVPEYAGLIVIRTPESKTYRDMGLLHVDQVKQPPLLHKKKLDDKALNVTRSAMLWKYYRAISKIAGLERQLEAAKTKGDEDNGPSPAGIT